jgi:hypothetical protein
MIKVKQEMLNLSQDVQAIKAGDGGTVSVDIGQFWIDRIVPNVIMPDAKYVGGLHEIMRVSERAREHGVAVYFIIRVAPYLMLSVFILQRLWVMACR